MGVRENKVETYLDDEVKSRGGITRKWVCPGHDGVPDRLMFICNSIFLVEVKTIDGDFKPGQEREHERLRGNGANVCTVWGNQGVDALMKDIDMYSRPMIKYYG